MQKRDCQCKAVILVSYRPTSQGWAYFFSPEYSLEKKISVCPHCGRNLHIDVLG